MGKTAVIGSVMVGRWKHPHVHGEDQVESTRLQDGLETPPRAWGRLSIVALPHYKLRNTPTCMGKTSKDLTLVTVCWKHPHVHGEDVSEPRTYSKLPETPPRAWGRPVDEIKSTLGM